MRASLAWRWATMDRKDALGLVFVAAAFAAVAGYTLWHWAGLGQCLGRTVSLAAELVASDAAIRDATSGSAADRCRAYRNRVALLVEGRRSMSVPSRGRGVDPPADYDTQLRFFDRVIAERCG